MAKKITTAGNEELVSTSLYAQMENDLACSAWHDKNFAVWFFPFAKADVLFNGSRGEAFFNECGTFAKAHKTAIGSTGDDPKRVLQNESAYEWYATLHFPELPGGRLHKPTTWQIDKARKYMTGRHNILLSEKLADAEAIREKGDSARADMIAAEARRRFTAFNDSSVECTRAMDDIDALLGLAESNPPLFTLDGEMGKLLNQRLKGDNLGVLLANQKIGKTTSLISLAVAAAKQVPTLFVSLGDETKIKVDGRVLTNLSCHVTQPEFAGKFAMPVPDCAHNANGTCPIGMSGEPRAIKCWKTLIGEGATPEELCEGSFEGSRTVSGNVYQPCCRCFPVNDGTKEDWEKRKRWKSAVWWRMEGFNLCDRKKILDTRNRFELDSFGGGLKITAYPGGEVTVGMLEEKLDALDRTENFVPLVLVIDYFDLFKQEIERGTDKDYDGMRINWQKLRGICFRRGILIITAIQTNREDPDIETHTVKTIGRCAKAADNCTWMATLNQTIAERRAKVMRLSMLFAREGKFDPEHQALCSLWLEVQDSFAFSAPIFYKTQNKKENK